MVFENVVPLVLLRLPLTAMMKLAATSHSMHAISSEEFYENILRAHFPSYYMMYKDKYKQGGEISWKNEYKHAYHLLILRRTSGYNILRNYVIHLGPYLEEDTIESISNFCEEDKVDPLNKLILDASASSKIKGYTKSGHQFMKYIVETVATEAIYYISEDGTLVVSNDKEDTRKALVVSVSKNKLYCKDENQIHCYDMGTKQPLWKMQISNTSQWLLCQDMVFYTNRAGIACMDAITGNLMFSITPDFAKEETEQPTKKPRVNDGSRCKPIVVERDYVIWTVSCSNAGGCEVVCVVDWKKQRLHGTYIFDEFKAFYFSKFAVSNGILVVHANLEYYRVDAGYCIAIDLQYDREQPELKKLWQFKRSGGFEPHYVMPPCIYMDIVFSFFYHFSHDEPKRLCWLVALDLKSGTLIWRWRFDPFEISTDGMYKPSELVVVEGTASICERQALREAHKPGTIIPFKGEIEEEQEEEENEEEFEKIYDDEEERLHALAVQQEQENDKRNDIIAQRVRKTKNTKFPVLRFSLANYEQNKYFEGAAIAYTGELLYFKKFTYE